MRCLDGKRTLFVGAALLTAVLPFWAPEACTQALQDGLHLCSGPLLLSLFPFLIVSTLLVRTGAGDLLGTFLRPLARLSGAKASCGGGVLLLGLAGGFAPAANAASQAVRAGKLSSREAAALLPACICSGPSFVILTVGQGMFGNIGVGVRLFAAQAMAGILSAAILCRIFRQTFPEQQPMSIVSAALPPLRLDVVIAEAALTYCKLCGFILYFRLLAGGLGAIWAKLSLPAAMVLEVCSGCDLASQTGRWASWLCCASISLQGMSVLLQVRTICPSEVSFRPLLTARLLHLPLSFVLFRLLLWLPGDTVTASTSTVRIQTQTPIILQRVPPDCAVLVLLSCCLLVCHLSRSFPPEHKQ